MPRFGPKTGAKQVKSSTLKAREAERQGAIARRHVALPLPRSAPAHGDPRIRDAAGVRDARLQVGPQVAQGDVDLRKAISHTYGHIGPIGPTYKGM